MLVRASFEQQLLKTNDETHLFDLVILQFSEVVGQKLCRYHPASPLWWKSNRREKDKPYDPFHWGRQNNLSPEATWVSCKTRSRQVGVFPPSVTTMSDSPWPRKSSLHIMRLHEMQQRLGWGTAKALPTHSAPIGWDLWAGLWGRAQLTAAPLLWLSFLLLPLRSHLLLPFYPLSPFLSSFFLILFHFEWEKKGFT